jgi:hypothetical protein
VTAELEAFARSCRDTSRQLRRVPAELRKALASEVQGQVAEPLAGKIAQAFTGPWSGALARSTKARKLADPTIVVGGARRVVSGGASGRQLVYGATFGGGSRVSTVTRRTSSGRSTSYKVHTTRQFRGKGRDDLFNTIRSEGAWVLTQFASIVDDVLGKAVNG